MLLAREFVAYISRQLVKRLTPGIIETSTPELVTEKITEVITEELSAEDRLNDEVRDLLSQYSEYMRREGVSYQEMFRRIKNTLISQRKVVRAAGRDTGDAMKLSRDKVTEISHRLVEMLRKNRDLRLKNKDVNSVRLEILRVGVAVRRGRREEAPDAPTGEVGGRWIRGRHSDQERAHTVRTQRVPDGWLLHGARVDDRESVVG